LHRLLRALTISTRGRRSPTRRHRQLRGCAPPCLAFNVRQSYECPAKNPAPMRPTFIRLGLVALACTLAMTSLYRPWIYARGYSDFFVADTIGSFGGALMATWLLPGLFCPQGYRLVKASVGAAIGAVLYEFVQPLVGTGVFDGAD